jgi:hypothetical protein
VRASNDGSPLTERERGAHAEMIVTSVPNAERAFDPALSELHREFELYCAEKKSGGAPIEQAQAARPVKR